MVVSCASHAIFSGVFEPHVAIKGARLRESKTADGAGEGLDTRVHSLVRDEVRFLTISSAAARVLAPVEGLPTLRCPVVSLVALQL